MTNKEVIKHLEGVALILKSRHMCKSMDSNCLHDEIVEYREQFESIKIAIESLEKTSDEGCSRCIYRGKCTIFDNFNIDYCSDWRNKE